MIELLSNANVRIWICIHFWLVKLWFEILVVFKNREKKVQSNEWYSYWFWLEDNMAIEGTKVNFSQIACWNSHVVLPLQQNLQGSDCDLNSKKWAQMECMQSSFISVHFSHEELKINRTLPFSYYFGNLSLNFSQNDPMIILGQILINVGSRVSA